MGSRWDDETPEPRSGLLADLLEQLHIEEPELEPEPASPAPSILYAFSGLLILASGFFGYLGWIPWWEGLTVLGTGLAVFAGTELAESRGCWS